MALITCHECKKSISSEASSCPNCGAKPPAKPKRKSLVLPLLGIAIGVAVVAPIVLEQFGFENQNADYCSNGMSAAKAYGVATRAVEARLKSPSTASFSSLTETSVARAPGGAAGECLFVVSGHVDAQNSFGAKLRSKFMVDVAGNSTGSGWVAKSVRM